MEYEASDRIMCMRTSAVIVGLIALLSPFIAFAFPFGGQASTVIPCYNQAIYAYLGPPRGGAFVWTTGTKTYSFGPPAFAGQWLLGLASAPYECLVSVEPIQVLAATAISMMGSSGPTAPASTYVSNSGGAGFTAQPSSSVYQTLLNSGANQGSSGPGSPNSFGHIFINEIFYNVDAAHGTKPQNEWIELYNGTGAYIDVSGWQIIDSTGSDTIPSGTTIPTSNYLVITDTASTATYWNIPNSAHVIVLGTPIGNGLVNAGDVVQLKNTGNTIVDAVSWGTNTTAFSPAVSVVAAGHSMVRKSLTLDTDAASDWIDASTPTPGR